MKQSEDIFASFAVPKKTTVNTNNTRRLQPNSNNTNKSDFQYGDNLEEILDIDTMDIKKKDNDTISYQPTVPQRTSSNVAATKDNKKKQQQVDEVDDILGEILGDQPIRPKTAQNPQTKDLDNKIINKQDQFFGELDDETNFYQTDQNFTSKYSKQSADQHKNNNTLDDEKLKQRDQIFGINRQTNKNEQNKNQKGVTDMDDPHNYSAFDVNSNTNYNQNATDIRQNYKLDNSSIEVGGSGFVSGGLGTTSNEVVDINIATRRRPSLKKTQTNTPNRNELENEASATLRRPGIAPNIDKTHSANPVDIQNQQSAYFPQSKINQEPRINVAATNVADSEENSEKDQSVSRRQKKTYTQLKQQNAQNQNIQNQQQQSGANRPPRSVQQQSKNQGEIQFQFLQSEDNFIIQNQEQSIAARKEAQYDVSERGLDNSITQSNQFGEGGGVIINQGNQMMRKGLPDQITIPDNSQKIQKEVIYIDEKNKIREREREEEFKISFDSMKKTYEEQIQLIKTNRDKDIEYERQQREKAIIDLQNSFQEQKKRLIDNHQAEMKLKDEQHEINMKNLRRQLEQETKVAQEQLDQQIKLNMLAEELRNNSEKLHHVTQKLEQNSANSAQLQQQAGFATQQNQSSLYQEQFIKLNKKERELQEMQDHLQTELQNVQKDKERMERLRSDLELKQLEFTKDLEKQKFDLHNEYVRLNELQDTLKNQDHEKRRVLLAERTLLDEERQQFEEEKIRMKEEYEQKYRSMFEQEQTFESVKRSQKEFLDKQSQQIREKLLEIDDLRKRATIQEFESLKKLKIIEEKEMEINRIIEENQRGSQKLQMDRFEFEREVAKFSERYQQIQNENKDIEQFRTTFEQEKRKIAEKENQLQEREKRLEIDLIRCDRDKNELKLMEQTMQGLRSEYMQSLTFENYRRAKQQTQQGFKGFQNQQQQDQQQFGRTMNESQFNNNNINEEDYNYQQQLQQEKFYFNQRKDEAPKQFTGQQFNQKKMKSTMGNSNGFLQGNKQEGIMQDNNDQKDQFNYANFMQNLQKYSNQSTQNNDYIVREKERILQQRLNQNRNSEKII